MRISDEARARGRSLLVPVVVVNTAMATGASLYLAVVARLPADTRLVFVSLALVTTLVALTVLVLLTERKVRTLRGLLAGRLEPTEANGAAAVQELWRHPMRLAQATGVLWLLGIGAVVAAFLLLTGEPVAIVTRLLPAGLAFAAMSAVGVGTQQLVAAQRLGAALCRELPARAVVAALPLGGMAGGLPVRTVAVVGTVVMVALPVLLLVVVAGFLHEDVAREALARLEAGTPVAGTDLWLHVGVLGLVVVVNAGAVARNLGTALTAPMQQMAEDARRVAKGELSRPALMPGIGEVWRASSVFALLADNLKVVMGHVQRAEGSLSGTVATLTDSAKRFQGGAEEQAAALNETSATTEELAHSARQIATNANAVLDIAQKTMDAADAGQVSAQAFQAAVARMQHDNQSIAAAVERLRGRVQQIGRIIEFINVVADRSDLLALSAELEGTRAGEVGRGFGLVASEMRRLAENVLESTAEVEELISEIREATRQTGLATERGSALALSSTGLAERVFKALTDVAELARQTSNAVRTISLATQQQQTGTDQLAEAMSDILGVTQQSLSATRQLSGANERLQGLSANLRSLVDRFQIAAR